MRPQTCDAVSDYLCNFLADHGVKPVKVLKKAGLRTETPADWHSGDAVHALYMASLPLMPQTLHTETILFRPCFQVPTDSQGLWGPHEQYLSDPWAPGHAVLCVWKPE